MPKRRSRDDDVEDDEQPLQRKTRRSAGKHEEPPRVDPPETPSGRKSALKGTPLKSYSFTDVDATPTSLKRVLFATPDKPTPEDEVIGDGALRSAGNDRSARRKSASTLQRQVVPGYVSDTEGNEGDIALAREILAEENTEDESDAETPEAKAVPDTPSKTRRGRGRPRGKLRDRSPSPPSELPPHEAYFFQNRAGANKTSANTLPSHTLLGHDDYRAQIEAHQDHHQADFDRLKVYHERAFQQWMFELDEGLNICLYGYGSKRGVVMEFVNHLYEQAEKACKIVVVNGYTPGLTFKDILATIASQVLPTNMKLPAQSSAILDTLLAELERESPSSRLVLVIHSLDHPHLRKHQSSLGLLASHPNIALIASCDTPNFALLWDIGLSEDFDFLYHDATTFSSYVTELDVIEDVNALLGRSSRRLGAKDGVGYVLKSLPENARSLFRILVAEQLALAGAERAMFPSVVQNDYGEDSDLLGVSDEDAAAQETPSRRGRRKAVGSAKPSRTPKASLRPATVAPEGVEFRILYHKTVEEFVCSSELNFRTLLKEFHDHQMIESRKDGLGTERLIVPFRHEELEVILEELV